VPCCDTYFPLSCLIALGSLGYVSLGIGVVLGILVVAAVIYTVPMGKCCSAGCCCCCCCCWGFLCGVAVPRNMSMKQQQVQAAGIFTVEMNSAAAAAQKAGVGL